jgi:hypothetical protein
MSKAVYVSLNLAEYEILMSKANFAEMGMYLILKKMANFKTGEVGSFRQQKLNYEKLAQQLSRPTRNTAPAETFDRGQARNIVARLERIGLVSEIRITNDALKLRLPLSPIYPLDEVSPEESAPALAETAECHRKQLVKTLLGPVDADGWDGDPFSINTDKDHQYDQYDHQSHTDDTVNNDDTDRGEGTSPSAARRIHPQPFLEEGEGMSAKLTTAQIKEELNTAGFRLLDYDLSKNLMRSWEKMNVDATELRGAIYKMHRDCEDLVPGKLDKVIRAMRQQEKSNTGRGKVAL